MNFIDSINSIDSSPVPNVPIVPKYDTILAVHVLERYAFEKFQHISTKAISSLYNFFNYSIIASSAYMLIDQLPSSYIRSSILSQCEEFSLIYPEYSDKISESSSALLETLDEELILSKHDPVFFYLLKVRAYINTMKAERIRSEIMDYPQKRLEFSLMKKELDERAKVLLKDPLVDSDRKLLLQNMIILNESGTLEYL